MMAMADCVLWADKSFAWGLVDFAKVRAISGPSNPVRIEARSLVLESSGLDGTIRHPSWVKGVYIQSRYWQQALFLAKSLTRNTQEPQEYWSDSRGYLFLAFRDGRGRELAVAIAPMETSDAKPESGAIPASPSPKAEAGDPPMAKHSCGGGDDTCGASDCPHCAPLMFPKEDGDPPRCEHGSLESHWHKESVVDPPKIYRCPGPKHGHSDAGQWHYCPVHEEIAPVGSYESRDMLRQHRNFCRGKITIRRMMQCDVDEPEAGCNP
jgi:hypothetical protein